MFDYILKNVQIADGSGAPSYKADAAVSDGMIAEIGSIDRSDGREIIEGDGCVLSPGFIDIHSHGDMSAPAFPDMESCVLQGITTVFGGHCGMSASPAHKYWRYAFFEDAAFAKIAPPPAGGQCPGKSQLMERQPLVSAFREAFGFDLDWNHIGEYYDHLDRTGIGANLACVVGHGQIRQQVMGIDDKREASPSEIEEMKRYLREAMEHGSLGMSFGLDYEPGAYASDEELLEMAQCLAEYDGLLTTHCQRRDFRRGVVKKQYYIDGLREVLEIARKTGVRLHVSHIACGYEVNPPDEDLGNMAAQKTLDMIESYRRQGVRVTWDVIPQGCGGEMFHFPYLATKLIPYVDQCGGLTAFSEKLKLPAYRAALSCEIKDGRHQSRSPFTRLDPKGNPQWAEGVIITQSRDEALIGRKLLDLSAEREQHFVDTILDLVAEDPWICWSREGETAWPGVSCFVSQPDASVCLDGGVFDMEYPAPSDYPLQFAAASSYCGMVKFLKGQLCAGASLEATIAKMTGNSAKKIGLRDRGFVKKGMAADLVLFRPEDLDPNEGAVDPRRAPKGILYVMVNGKIEVDHGVCRRAKAGKTLRGPF